MKEKHKIGPDTAQDTRLRIMSYNIHSGIGMDNRYDLDRIAGDILESGADIVGLQEVDVHWGARSQFQDTIEQLAAKLKMYAFFAPIYELFPLHPGQQSRKFGVAALSRYPMRRIANHRMSRLSTQDKDQPLPLPMPGFAEAVLDVDGIRLTVFVAHLDYRSDPSVRIIQVRELLDIVSQCAGSHLLLGDFNAGPDAAELSPLFGRYRDTWAETEETRRNENGFTFPADVPKQKIDYILTSPGIHIVSSQVLQTFASDHRPVIADILLPPNGDA